LTISKILEKSRAIRTGSKIRLKEYNIRPIMCTSAVIVLYNFQKLESNLKSDWKGRNNFSFGKKGIKLRKADAFEKLEEK